MFIKKSDGTILDLDRVCFTWTSQYCNGDKRYNVVLDVPGAVDQVNEEDHDRIKAAVFSASMKGSDIFREESDAMKSWTGEGKGE